MAERRSRRTPVWGGSFGRAVCVLLALFLVFSAPAAGASAGQAACTLPRPADSDKVLLIASSGGALFSTHTLQGQSLTTTAATVHIPAGAGKLYVMLSSRDATVWKITGDAQRVAALVLMGPSVSGGIAAAETGVPKERVAIVSAADCYPLRGVKKDVIAGGTLRVALEKELHRMIDAAAWEERIWEVNAAPTGINFTAPPAMPPVPQDLDDETWTSASRFSIYRGVENFALQDIVSGAPVAPYLVLPQYAGLAQLVKLGALVHANAPKIPPARPGAQVVIAGVYVNKYWIVSEMPAYPAEADASFVLVAGVRPPPVTGRVCVMSQETGKMLLGASGCVFDRLAAPPAGRDGECPLSGDPGFRAQLQQLFLAKSREAASDKDRDDEIETGSAAADVFFKSGRRKNVSIYGRGSGDIYFLPLKSGNHKIIETPVAGEMNTLVVTDIDYRNARPSFSVAEEGALLIKDDPNSSRGIKIANWQGPGNGVHKPVSCFVFSPNFEVLSANDVIGWIRGQEFGVPARASAPHAAKKSISDKGATTPRLFHDLPANTQIQYVGVYESELHAQRPPGVEGNVYGTITVNVWKRAPVLLVLTSYEPVRWQIIQEEGAHVAGVIISGYYPQSVESDIVGVPIYDLSRGKTKFGYFHGYDEAAVTRHMPRIGRLTGVPLERLYYQGSYKGSYFDIE
ncbi:MAG TPA: hypothetical protein VEF76_10135 [Patescibacteria group bacterium]|nr:hypothetical protein [Patescibacteria group bacterium]